MRHFTLATLAVAVVATAVPAFAQSLDELTVYGRGRDAESLSRTVSYADLDLAFSRDRGVLRQRISFVARDLCDQLNEPGPSAANLGRSCQDLAVRDAMGQVREAVADARERLAYDGY